MHNRRKFLTQTSLAVGAFTFLNPLKSFAQNTDATAEQRTLTILYTNGLAGQWSSLVQGGGLANVKQAVDAIRREQQNVLLVDAGNVLARASSKSIEHLHYFKELKKTGYDAITAGSDDMQHGSGYFSRLVESSKVDAIVTNVSDEHIDADALYTHKIVRKRALKIGIIGVGNTGKINAASFSRLQHIITAKAEKLKENHRCQLVVCLSHLPLKNELTHLDNIHLAKTSAAVDVFISANDERFVYNTHVVKNKHEQDVFLSHAGNKGAMLGRLNIRFSKDGQPTGITTEQVFTGNGKNGLAAFKQHAAVQLA